MRQMPIEVSFDDVKKWVIKHPMQVPKKNWYSLFKDFLFSVN